MSFNLQDQIAWEKECIERGSQKYFENQDRLRDQGQADQTDVVSHLLHARLEEVAKKIEEVAEKQIYGVGAKYNKMLRLATLDCDYKRIAYIGTQCAFQIMMTKEKNTVLKVCINIASRLEADLKCAVFKFAHPAYYAAVDRSFKDQKVVDYQHKHKVLMKKFSDFDLEWDDWTAQSKGMIGQRVLAQVLAVFYDVLFIHRDWSRGKQTARLNTTPLFDDWAAEFEKERGFMNPPLLPLKIPPKAWEYGIRHGGYYTPSMCTKLPFVKTKGKAAKKFVLEANPQAHRQAVNKMQRTPWMVNRRVFDIQSEIYTKGLGVGMPSNTQIVPPEFPEHLKEVAKEDLSDNQKEEIGDWKLCAKNAYSKEQTRKGKVLAFMQSHKLAAELVDWDKFYYAYNCDFRGRIYCATSGLSPQGADTSKGMLHFAKGLPLGTDGVKWLAIHGANTFGEDKLSYEDRVTWIGNQEENIRMVNEDPIGTRGYWGSADKPYQFLAFCFEWHDCDYGVNTKTISHIPIGLDGSCNGLQHYSAMLKDEVGAKATNLMPCQSPEDIYQEVADVCTEKLKQLNDPRAKKWLKVGVNRKCAKRPVMTLPYGAKQMSARMYVLEYVEDNWSAFELDESYQWEFAKFLSPILWESIGEVVIAARSGMAWLQKNAKKDYMRWITPIGFPVYQHYKDVKNIMIQTMLLGSMRLSVRDLNNDGEPNFTQQKSGIAPNFVHSIDSTHMVITINGTDLDSYAMIHDDFGTHAANTERLFVAIRKAFKKLYVQIDPLEHWGKQVGADLETLPQKGEYDIQDILKADYFFG